MDKQIKKKTTDYRSETTKKNFRYNRFLLLRYLLAIFFFVNLNLGIWLGIVKCFSAILPLCLIILCIPAAIEHVKLLGDMSDEISEQLRFNRLYYQIQVIVNLFFLFVAITGVGFKWVFPFLQNTMPARIFVLGLVIVGTFLSIVCIRRINAIQTRTDKYYGYIQKYEQLVK